MLLCKTEGQIGLHAFSCELVTEAGRELDAKDTLFGLSGGAVACSFTVKLGEEWGPVVRFGCCGESWWMRCEDEVR